MSISVLMLSMLWSSAVQAADGSISGTISSSSDAPLGSIEITAYTSQTDDITGYVSWIPDSGTVILNSDGTYLISNLAPDVYHVGVVDLNIPRTHLSEFYENARLNGRATEIIVGDGQAVSGIDIELDEYAKIRGTVTDEAAQPLQGIPLQLYEHDNGRWEPRQIVETDTDGTYLFTIKDFAISREDNALIRIGPDYIDEETDFDYIPVFYDGAQDIDSATDIPVAPGTVASNIDVQLARAGSISGKVSRQDPEENTIIQTALYALETCCNNWILMDSHIRTQDEYLFLNLPAGTYRIGVMSSGHASKYYGGSTHLEDATDIVVGDGADVGGIDIALEKSNSELDSLGRISGIVTDEVGNPLADIPVTYFATGSTGWFPAKNVTTNVNGEYLLDNLYAGYGRIRFGLWESDPSSSFGYRTEYYNDVTNLDDAETFLISSSFLFPEINAQLAAAGKIAGRVTDTYGNPIHNMPVYPYLGSSGNWKPREPVYTDEDGNYIVDSLPTANVRLRFGLLLYDSSPPYDYVPEFYNDVFDIEEASDISVTLGTTTFGINAQVLKKGRINGRVTDTSGNPVASSYVEVFRLAGEPCCAEWIRVTGAGTATDGTYSVHGLGDDTYRISASDNPPRQYRSMYYGNAREIDEATDVVIDKGATVDDIDIALLAFSKIKGRVIDPDGNPLVYVNLNLYKGTRYPCCSDWQPFNQRRVQTNGSGEYIFEQVYSGVYRLGTSDHSFFHNAPFYPGVYYENAKSLDSATNIFMEYDEVRTLNDIVLVPEIEQNATPIPTQLPLLTATPAPVPPTSTPPLQLTKTPLATPGAPTTPEPTQTPIPTPLTPGPTQESPPETATTNPSGCGPLEQEAETGTLTDKWLINEHDQASGGQYISVPDTDGLPYATVNNHQASYCFTVTEAGTYRVLGWFYAEDEQDNSLFMTLDGQSTDGHVWEMPVDTTYAPAYANRRGGDDPLEVHLVAGEHVVTLSLREDGLRVDKIALVPVDEAETLPSTPVQPGENIEGEGESTEVKLYLPLLQ